MGVPQSPTPPHLYPQALQLKLYQAFIFSIPILFSIILFLLFYLFYLKRRASNSTSISFPPLPRPRRSHQTTTYVSSPCQFDLKVELKDELPIVLFDEELRKRDSQCCVCLGEFVVKEELLQVPSCKHIFHIDCIHLWLHTNTTCPLCRCSVLPAAPKLDVHPYPMPPPPSIISEPPAPSGSGTRLSQLSNHSDIESTMPISEPGSVVIYVQTHAHEAN
ncbi:RING-H2 zinc finger protein RHA4a [Morus notabilis]|uniref:RING-type E3 ubiquitin transferase n=1 Tax=Morus notabilis TaxID=981085 RepID=W9S747_9ROSA|nr:probable E3 ubiquitin-protein ligase RHA4A [Morus notabilis]EXC14470.1 RING-H2 zinc finger protein RHA4a [Morus notabilis]